MDRKYEVWARLKAKEKEVEVQPSASSFSLPGVPERYEKILVANGYNTVEKIKEAGYDKIVDLKGIGPKSAKEIFEVLEVID